VWLTLGNNMETKEQIRMECFSRREQLSQEKRDEYSDIIYKRVVDHPFYKSADYILLYADFNEEVQTGSIVKKAMEDEKKVFFPKVFGDTMDYYLFHNYKELHFGYMGIQEPDPTNYEFIHELRTNTICPKRILMIMPGVAFDKNRNRVGYGKGFFDKYLAYLDEKIKGDELIEYHTIALAYTCQIVDEIPAEEMDRRPEVVITETIML